MTTWKGRDPGDVIGRAPIVLTIGGEDVEVPVLPFVKAGPFRKKVAAFIAEHGEMIARSMEAAPDRPLTEVVKEIPALVDMLEDMGACLEAYIGPDLMERVLDQNELGDAFATIQEVAGFFSQSPESEKIEAGSEDISSLSPGEASDSSRAGTRMR